MFCGYVVYWSTIGYRYTLSHITVMFSKNIYIALELIDTMGDTGNRADTEKLTGNMAMIVLSCVKGDIFGNEHLKMFQNLSVQCVSAI